MAGKAFSEAETKHQPVAENMLTEEEAEALKNTYLDARQGSRDADKLDERLPVRCIVFFLQQSSGGRALRSRVVLFSPE
ncbi:unnamed protein product [Sympodiomycopsis kandeliae]